MKTEHKQILNFLEEYLSQPGADSLRFWQALYNTNVVVFQDKMNESTGTYEIKDDHNISDIALLKRLKG